MNMFLGRLPTANLLCKFFNRTETRLEFGLHLLGCLGKTRLKIDGMVVFPKTTNCLTQLLLLKLALLLDFLGLALCLEQRPWLGSIGS